MHFVDTNVPKGGVGVSKSSPNTRGGGGTGRDPSESQITNQPITSTTSGSPPTPAPQPTPGPFPSAWKQISASLMLPDGLVSANVCAPQTRPLKVTQSLLNCSVEEMLIPHSKINYLAFSVLTRHEETPSYH